jgi:hypothetical protein
MSKSFLHFNDRLVSSDSVRGNSDLAKELRNTTAHFLNLAKSTSNNASADSAESDSEQANILSAERAPLPTPHILSRDPVSGPRMVDVGLGYVQYLEDPPIHGELTPPTDGPDFSDITIIPHPNEGLPDGANSITAENAYNAQISSQFPTTPPQDDQDFLKALSPPVPYTFSVNETTFARRLERAGFERGFHILSNPAVRPEAFQRVFRLSLPYNSRESLLQKVKSVLTSADLKPLIVEWTPFIHLGGAGLHYSAARTENSYIIRFGPNKRARVQHMNTGLDGGIEFDVDPKEYEGEWFDSNDVEGFLVDLGIFINPRASFAEAQVAENSPLMRLLRKNGVVPETEAQSPALWQNGVTATAPLLTSETAETNALSGAVTTTMDETRLFQELGMADTTTIGPQDELMWSADLNNATGWLMGSGDRTPEFTSSGWAKIGNPSPWEPSDAVVETFRSHSHTPERTVETMRKVTVDVTSLVNCKFIIIGFTFGSNLIRYYIESYLSWAGTWISQEGCRTSIGYFGY